MTATSWSRLGIIALAAAAAIASLPSAAAEHDSNGNHGTVKIHDDPSESPPQRNVPHIDCGPFYVEGFNMAAESGMLTIYSWPPTGNKSVVLEATWTADDEAMEHFMEGPFELPSGHYKLEATNIAGHAKMKVFWIDECEAPEVPCPTDLVAFANTDGTITLEYTGSAEVDSYNVYRATGDGEFEFVGSVSGDSDVIVDVGTEVGVTYTYRVAAVIGGTEAENCMDVEVTAIPEFPGMLAMTMAAGLGVLAYATLRRKA